MKMGSYWQAGSAFIPQVESRAPTNRTDAYNQVSVAKNTASLIFTEFVNDFTQPHIVLAWWMISCLKKEKKNNYESPFERINAQNRPFIPSFTCLMRASCVPKTQMPENKTDLVPALEELTIQQTNSPHTASPSRKTLPLSQH